MKRIFAASLIYLPEARTSRRNMLEVFEHANEQLQFELENFQVEFFLNLCANLIIKKKFFESASDKICVCVISNVNRPEALC